MGPKKRSAAIAHASSSAINPTAILFPDLPTSKLLYGFQIVAEPLGLVRLAATGHALGARPAVYPGESSRAHVVLGQLVCIVAQSFIERNESIAAPAKHGESFGHCVGIHLTGVQQEN